MRQSPVLIFLFVLQIVAAPFLTASSSDPSELFLNAYLSVQKGEKLEQEGHYKLALQKYRYAASLLDQIHEKTPEWQPLIVEYRKKKTAETIAKIEQKISLEGPGSTREEVPPVTEPPLPQQNADQSAPSVNVTPSVTTPTTTAGGSDVFDNAAQEIRTKFQQMQEELNETKRKYIEVQREKEELSSKLDTTIKQLDQSRINESQIKSQLTQAQEAYKNASAERTKDIEEQKQLKDEVARLENILKDARAERDVAEEANEDIAQKIKGTKAERDAAVKQRDEALESLAKSKEAQQQVDKLMAENTSLMQRLGDAEKTIADFKESGPKKDEEIAGLKKEVSGAREQLAAALKQSQESQDAMNDLQTQLESATTELAQIQGGAIPDENGKKLADENQLLRGIVLRARKEEAHRDQEKKLIFAELEKLNVQSGTLMEKINYLGQPVVKLTDQERALFKRPQIEISDTGISIAAPKPEATSSPTPEAAPEPSATPDTTVDIHGATPFSTPAPSVSPAPAKEPAAPPVIATTPAATPATGKKTETPRVETRPTPPVPAELIPMANEAKEQFERGNYRQAEKGYQEVLSKAPDNIYARSNLGVVQYRSGKYKSAEETFRKVIAVSPDDAFSHRTLGIIYYTQGKLDQAVGDLTKALAIAPKDPIAHNYLGIAASAKGWQEAARKELETAIALDPSYADAHFNLAVIYATTPPVDKVNAKTHYKRAIELGAEPEPALEQLLKK